MATELQEGTEGKKSEQAERGQDLQSATQHAKSFIADNPPLSPQSSVTFAEPSSLIESNSTTDGRHQRGLRHRLKSAIGCSSSSAENINKDHVSQLIRSVSEYEPGYGKIAAFSASDPSFLIYRRFSWLHNRILLHLQDELVDLEEQLEGLDKWEAEQGNPTKLLCRRLDDAVPEESERRKLLEQCREKLDDYDALLLRLRRKEGIQKPSMRDQNSLYNLIDTSESVLHSESEWIRRSDDLVALAPGADKGWLNAFLAEMLMNLSRKLTLAIFRTPSQRLKTGSESTLHLLSASRLEVLIRPFLTTTAALLLLMPAHILGELQSAEPSEAIRARKDQLLTIFMFTMLFSALGSTFLKTSRQEMLAASAAYCAVLVVYMGILGTGEKMVMGLG